MSFKDLPTEISLEILKRLPPTSLICFKGVCRDWYNLASHPTLANLYRNRLVMVYSEHFKKLYVIDASYMCDKDDNIHNRTRSIVHFNVPFTNRRCEISCVLSCNGLVLFSYCRKEGDYYYSEFSVYNPLIDKFATLPSSDRIQIRSHYGEPLRDKSYGFGFDPVSEKYKVVSGGNNLVFTLGGSYWRPTCGRSTIPYNEPGLCLNGTLNWLRRYYDGGNTRGIVSFDLFHEIFRIIPMPYGIAMGAHLAVLGGCLSIVSHDGYSLGGCLDIWSMTVYGVAPSWTKMFRIKSDLICPSTQLMFPQTRKLFFMDFNRNSWYYDPETGSCVDIYWREVPFYSHLTTFKASLIWPFM